MRELTNDNVLVNSKGLFDDAAISYDSEFSTSNIGTVLRKLVWRKLNKYLQQEHKYNILEINCGTGEDAIYISSFGHQVSATDQSAKMIEVAVNKNHNNNLSFEILDFRDIGNQFQHNTFDIAFSNFGGLNCANTDEIKKVIHDIVNVLKPGGKFIGIIMGTKCLWEQVYYSIKGDKEKQKRRFDKNGILTTIGRQNFYTYYYSPDEIKNMLPARSYVSNIFPIGFFVPPSYLESYFKHHPKQLNLLGYLEKRVNNISWLANYADHYMIIVEKKQS